MLVKIEDIFKDIIAYIKDEVVEGEVKELKYKISFETKKGRTFHTSLLWFKTELSKGRDEELILSELIRYFEQSTTREDFLFLGSFNAIKLSEIVHIEVMEDRDRETFLKDMEDLITPFKKLEIKNFFKDM